MSRSSLVFAIALLLGAASAIGAEESNAPHRFLITSSKHNQRLESFEVSNSTLGIASEVPWSVRKTTLHGGKQEGVDLITIDNGRLTITVIPTRGLSVLEVRSGEMRLGWDSPVKEVVHPQFVNLSSRGGLGWLEGFNEWMVRCGLEYAGHPGKDQFIDNTGNEAEMDLTLHGRIGNLPASEVEVLIDRRPPHRIRVRGIVHERQFYGPKLRLAAEISSEPGSSEFRIDDAITNLGAFDQEFQMIYHANYGRPLLDSGSQVVTAAKKVVPMNDHAAKAIGIYATYTGPTKGFIEQVYLIDPYTDAAGRATVLLHNAAGDRGASIRWSTAQLPRLTVWKNTAAVEDGYVTGLEPGTGFPFNRRVERKAGRVPKLAPGKSHRMTLDYGLHHDKPSVQEVLKTIAAIQAGRPTEMQRAAPEVD